MSDNVNSFQEYDKRERDIDSDAETEEKEKTVISNMEHMRLHVLELGQTHKCCKEKNKIRNRNKIFSLEQMINNLN